MYFLPHCVPMSHVVTTCASSRNAVATSEFCSFNNFSITFLCWAFAYLASLSFLCLGGDLKENIIGTVSGFSIHLDDPKPSSTNETQYILVK